VIGLLQALHGDVFIFERVLPFSVNDIFLRVDAERFERTLFVNVATQDLEQNLLFPANCFSQQGHAFFWALLAQDFSCRRNVMTGTSSPQTLQDFFLCADVI
jgi:hypothetical protein